MADDTYSAIPCDVNTLEFQKFTLDSEGRVRVKIAGTFTATGLNIAGRVTEVTLNDTTWTALPATALAARNAIAVQNQSEVEIKVNYDNGVAGYVGMVVPAGGERFYDITSSIILYAKASSGSPKVAVEEIS